jgi:hypothetical protein
MGVNHLDFYVSSSSYNLLNSNGNYRSVQQHQPIQQTSMIRTLNSDSSKASKEDSIRTRSSDAITPTTLAREFEQTMNDHVRSTAHAELISDGQTFDGFLEDIHMSVWELEYLGAGTSGSCVSATPPSNIDCEPRVLKLVRLDMDPLIPEQDSYTELQEWARETVRHRRIGEVEGFCWLFASGIVVNIRPLMMLKMLGL